jgi:hypothetical protein
MDSLGMKRLSLGWLLHTFTVEHKRERVADSQRRLKVLSADVANEFANLITADES